MRTATAGQQANLESLDRQYLVRVQIADHLGALQDYTLAGGASVDWLNTWSMTEGADQPSKKLVLKLKREVSGTSVAPGVNANDPIKEGRAIVFSEQAVAQGASPSTWAETFRGTVDRVDWGGDEVTVESRDQVGLLIDAWMEDVGTYGSVGGTAQESVMQALVNASSLGAGVITLSVPVSPGFSIYEYEQSIQQLFQALATHRDLIGWDLRDKWDEGTGTWKVTYSEPNRSKTTPDHTFTDDDYYDVPSVSRDTTGVRNVAIGLWDEAQPYEIVEDAASIAEFRRRPMFFDASQDPQINTQQRMIDLLTAAVGDTAQPLLQAVIEAPRDWRFELGDLIRWTANLVHSSTDLDLAIVGMEHSGAPGQASTTKYSFKTHPAGGVLRWYQKDRLVQGKQNIESVSGVFVNTDTIPPTVEVKPSQSGSTGTVELVINDPDGLVNATAFKTQTDGGDFDFTDDPTGWPGYDNVAPFGLTQSVTLNRKHNALIGWAVRYDPTGAGSVWIRGAVTLDADFTPDVEIQGVARDPNDGTLTISVKGDEDTADVRLEWSIGADPAQPGDPTLASPALGARSGIYDTGEVAEPGEIVWVKAAGETAGGALAPDSFIAEGKFEVAGVPDGSVTTDKLADGAVIADKIVKQSQAFVSTVQFSPNGNSGISWTSGNVQTADGDSVAVNSGTASTPALPSRLFVYFNGTATLATTSTYSDVLADGGYILLCVAWIAQSASQDATVIPAVGVMSGGVFIGENEISADAIKTGHLQANSVTAGKISVASLSAISADIGTITAGTLQANVVVASDTLTASDLTVEGTLGIECGLGSSQFAFSDAAWGGDPTFLLPGGPAITAGTGYIAFGHTVSSADIEYRFPNLASENGLTLVDSGESGGTEAAWLEVKINGSTYYARLYTTA